MYKAIIEGGYNKNLDIRQYKTIKLQIDNEKEKLMLEISLLLQERKQLEQKKLYEIHVFQSRGKLIGKREIVAAGFLSAPTFSPEKMKELNKKIQTINEFIKRNESILEKLKEKERTVDNMLHQYQQQCRKQAAAREEKALLDLKMCISTRMVVT